MAVFDRMWIESSEFRRSMYRITIAWAVLFLAQAGITALIIASTSFDTAYIWDQALPIVALVIAMMLSVMIGRRSQHSGKN